MLLQEGYFATALKIPYVIKESTGIYLFVSTAASSTLYMQNMVELEARRIVTEPFWFKYDVWQFEDMAFLNQGEFLNTKYNGHFVSDVETFFQLVFCLNPRWKEQYAIINGGEYLLDSLRRVVVEGMRANIWLEITSGRSWRSYGSLDVYLRVMTTSMRPPKEEAWYILNATKPFVERTLAAPEDWYLYNDYHAVGQREIIADFYLKVFQQGLVPRRIDHEMDMPPAVFRTLPVSLQDLIQRRRLERSRL